MLFTSWVMLALVATATSCSTHQTGAADKPAPTPAAALERWLLALSSGDEAAYRGIVRFRPPAEYARAHGRAILAAARLHHAVRAHGVTGKRVRDAGFDTNETLLANAPLSGDALNNAIARIRQTKWTIDGNIATQPGVRDPMGGSGTTMEREGGGWVVVMTDRGAHDGRNDPAAQQYVRKYAAAASITADVLDKATVAVNDRRLRTIRQVNDFITAEREAISQTALDAMRTGPPRGPVVVVTDMDTGKPVAGATVSADFIVPPLTKKQLDATTGDDGRARLAAEPDAIPEIHVNAPGYAYRNAGLQHVRSSQAGVPDEIRITIGKPAVVEVTLELPDERHAAMSVYEGEADEPAPAALREQIAQRGPRTVALVWAAEPPALPKHEMMLRVNLYSTEGNGGDDGAPGTKNAPATAPTPTVSYRVTRARIATTEREVPVFRGGGGDTTPRGEQTFGLYDLGKNAFRDTVFVIGTLAEAREAESQDELKFQWTRNERVLGKETTRPQTRDK